MPCHESIMHQSLTSSHLRSKNCGKDASEAFWNYHSEKVLKSVADEYKIGEGECVCAVARCGIGLLTMRPGRSCRTSHRAVKPGSKL